MRNGDSEFDDSGITWVKTGESRKTVSPYYSQAEKEYTLPNGERKIAYVGHHRPFAIGLALTPQNKVVLVREFRPGPERVVMDLPCGAVNHGEDSRSAMIRELEEETGYRAGSVELVNVSFVSPYSNQERHTFLCRDCVPSGGQQLDHDEFINLVVMDLGKFFREYVLTGKTTNAAAVLYCLDKMNLLQVQLP